MCRIVSVGPMTSPPRPFRPVADPPPPRRVRTGWIVAACLVPVLAVCALPMLGLVVWWWGGPDRDEPRAAATAYLRLIEAGDDAAAYRMICPEVRAEVTAAAFGAEVRAGPRPAAHEVTDVAFLDEAGSAAAVGSRVTDRAGATRQVRLRLENRHGTWQVCGDTLV